MMVSQDRDEALLEALQGAATLEEAIYDLRSWLQVDHVTYHFAQSLDLGADTPFVKSTYAANWISRYLLKGYVRVDPVVKQGFKSQLPFFWHDLEIADESLELMRDAIAHGLGASGYSIPIIDRKSRRALLSLNCDMEAPAWCAFIKERAPLLLSVAHEIHKRAIFDIYGDNDPMPVLARRELEVLTWTALGKDHKAIACILEISEHTVRSYLKSCRHKLDCTSLAQCVAKAIQLRIINP